MGAKSSKLKQPTSVVPGATSEDPPLPIEPVVFRKDNADAYDKPSLQPQDPQDPQAPQAPQETEINGLQKLSAMQGALKYSDKILYKYIKAANERYLLIDDPARYGQYKSDIARHNGYCIKAAREILQNVTLNTKYSTCKKPSFSFYRSTKPSESEYSACIAMKTIAECIVDEETEIYAKSDAESNSSTLSTLVDIDALLLKIFKPLVADDETCISFIWNITGRNVSGYLSRQSKQPQQGVGGGGKKSRSMRRAHATSIRPHRRNTRIHHHSVSHRNKCIRTPRHKRTVRRSRYQRK